MHPPEMFASKDSDVMKQKQEIKQRDMEKASFFQALQGCSYKMWYLVFSDSGFSGSSQCEAVTIIGYGSQPIFSLFSKPSTLGFPTILWTTFFPPSFQSMFIKTENSETMKGLR